jgi:predicted GIY-YIG superfamily endonuclease
MKLGVIYKVTCLVNGKIYIGQTVDLTQRENMSRAQKGKKRAPMSAETIKKIGDSQRGKTRRPRKEEEKMQQSESLKKTWALRKQKALGAKQALSDPPVI